MSDSFAIQVKNISKVYHIYDKPRHRLQEMLRPVLGKVHSRFNRPYGHEFWALKDVSFEVKKGEAFGIIGKNGAGKSTLLQIIAGTLTPTMGEVQVNGRVNALLELGSGFNPEFTGRENVYMNGAILGFSKKYIDEKFNAIHEFSEIGEYIDQPVKTYSSGMFVRLAFSVQAFLDPEILIVDEALAVGDIFFVQKCHNRIDELLASGNTTFLFVTHDIGAIQKYCKKALLLENGRVKAIGDSKTVIVSYYDQSSTPSVRMEEQNNRKPDNAENISTLDWSRIKVIGENRKVNLIDCRITNSNDEMNKMSEIGCSMKFKLEFEVIEEMKSPTFGLNIMNEKGIPVFVITTLHLRAQVPETLPKGARVHVTFSIKMDLACGKYALLVSSGQLDPMLYKLIFSEQVNWASFQDRIENSVRFVDVSSFEIFPKHQGLDIPFMGLVGLPSSVQVNIEGNA